jgi:nanoRNase/pAp phosphatase (c-di-AMP/oligoRNAs hydrolase)
VSHIPYHTESDGGAPTTVTPDTTRYTALSVDEVAEFITRNRVVITSSHTDDDVTLSVCDEKHPGDRRTMLVPRSVWTKIGSLVAKNGKVLGGHDLPEAQARVLSTSLPASVGPATQTGSDPDLRPDVCLYHADCKDGLVAAWAIWRRWPDAGFIPVDYDNPPPPGLDGKRVLIVDFSYPADVLLRLAELSECVTVLDHHESAQRHLADLPVYRPDTGQTEFVHAAGTLGLPRVRCLFDMERSGAMLAWDYAYPDDRAPRIVEHVQDHDLQRFRVSGTRAVMAVLESWPDDFASVSEIAARLERSYTRAMLLTEGEAIMRWRDRQTERIISANSRLVEFAGHTVPIVCIPRVLASHAGHLMAKGRPFAVSYFDDAEGFRQYSLRSEPDGENVALIAEMNGGSGHAHAAGFRAPFGSMPWEKQ